MKLFDKTWSIQIVLFFVGLLCLFYIDTSFLDTVNILRLAKVFNDINDDLKDYCDGESFSYRHISFNGTEAILKKGKPFNCSLVHYLEKLKLTKEHEIKKHNSSYFPHDLVFVTGVDDKYFPSMQVSFSHIRKQYGYKNKIILYDLGGIKEKHESQIAKMCNVELRSLDFAKFPKHVHDLKLYSWKVLVLAEVFNEADNIMYLDTSVNLNSSNYDRYLKRMAKFELTPFLMMSDAWHSADFAISNLVYDYLPLDLNYKKGTQMMEGGFLLLYKSEPARQFLKWAVLCALTLDCIQPPDTTMFCNLSRINESGVCSRQDQSVFNVLVNNLEHDLKNQGFGTILNTDPEHPHRKDRLFWIERRQKPKTPINLECKNNSTHNETKFLKKRINKTQRRPQKSEVTLEQHLF